jgi:hypothetical protein
MDRWWHRDVIEAGKLPLMLCFLAFVLTFAITRTITRLIRAGRGPFKDQVSSSGVHVHHAIPGLILLIIGAFIGVSALGSDAWTLTSAILVGMGTSLVLDEFALLLRLTDVYWSNEGRISVDMVSLTAACLGLVLVGISPVGVNEVGTTELAVRISGIAILAIHGLLVFVCVLKSKYRIALFGLFLSPIALFGAVRLGRPGSVWARRRYSGRQTKRATERAADFDRRFAPLQHRWENLVGGRPSLPDPPGS